jgi:hypothetical protein
MFSKDLNGKVIFCKCPHDNERKKFLFKKGLSREEKLKINFTSIRPGRWCQTTFY